MNPKILAPAFVLGTALALVGAGCVSTTPRVAAPPTAVPTAVAACAKAGTVTFAAANDASTDWNVYLNGTLVNTSAHAGEASVEPWLEVPGTTYLALNPSGLGGYIPYAGNETLLSVNHCTGTVSAFTAPTGGMSLMALSHDGTRLISTATFEGTTASTHVFVWDTNEALTSHDAVEPIADYVVPDEWAFVGDFVFNADNSKLAFAAGDGPDDEHGAAYALDLSTGKFSKVAEHATGLLSVDGFNADGTVKTH